MNAYIINGKEEWVISTEACHLLLAAIGNLLDTLAKTDYYLWKSHYEKWSDVYDHVWRMANPLCSKGRL